MSKSANGFAFTVLIAVTSLSVFSWAILADDSSGGANPEAVDDDMHHFMEYVFEPNYKRLKGQMATAPQENAAWKAIKGDALTLAECANLLLLRGPEERASQWRRLSIAVRKNGGNLYQAARATDYAAARESYTTMLNNCNRCHQLFADGEHQLEP